MCDRCCDNTPFTAQANAAIGPDMRRESIHGFVDDTQCDHCDWAMAPETPSVPHRRKKLWELSPEFHCPILGTCLTIVELGKVMRQSGVTLETRPSDYDLHATMVGQAARKGAVSRNLHKFLDRKYQRWIQALSKCRESAELDRRWKQALATGDIAGIFWALMTHPSVTKEFSLDVWGDVHMMSHLQGASNRADLRRMKELEEEVAELQATLVKARQHHNEQMARRDETIRRQEEELLAERTRKVALSAQADASDAGAELRKRNRALVGRLDWAEGQLAEREMLITVLEEKAAGLKEILQEEREERLAIEGTLSLLLAERAACAADRTDSIDLGGKKILYVGGRSTLTPHLRSLVEAFNGRFEHHDGGKEDGRSVLQCSLAGADMVFCPIDCISHDACLRVKRHCRRQSKQFVPLRSSGLSAFASRLRQLSPGAVEAT